MKVSSRFFVLPFLFLSVFAVAANAQWLKQSVNTTASLRGLSVVNEKIVWASGTGGTVIRTADGGKTWNVITVPDAEKLDFRDIEAFDANTAYSLSIGNGESSRIYKTIDGGKNWELQFKNTNEKAFFDAIACWDRLNCIAMSDPVDGHFPIISTTDGGRNWKLLVSNQMAEAAEGEAAFAASGTCLITQGKNNAFLVSGGSRTRVFRSTNRGLTWTTYDTPIAHGTPGSGIFSIAMFDDKNGVIVGGNYEKPGEAKDNLAFTSDGGKTWRSGNGLNGYRSGVAYIEKNIIVAVGTNGSDISDGGGKIWRNRDKEPYNSVQAKGEGAVWAVGPKGMVAILVDILKLVKINPV
jgi:photosystem II stability/assembly factor-like uncharacterized protein